MILWDPYWTKGWGSNVLQFSYKHEIKELSKLLLYQYLELDIAYGIQTTKSSYSIFHFEMTDSHTSTMFM